MCCALSAQQDRRHGLWSIQGGALVKVVAVAPTDPARLPRRGLRGRAVRAMLKPLCWPASGRRRHRTLNRYTPGSGVPKPPARTAAKPPPLPPAKGGRCRTFASAAPIATTAPTDTPPTGTAPASTGPKRQRRKHGSVRHRDRRVAVCEDESAPEPGALPLVRSDRALPVSQAALASTTLS
jgi:hypothetical protein